MAFIPVPNTWEVRVAQTIQNLVFPINLFHITWDGAITLTQARADTVAEKTAEVWDTSGISGYQSIQYGINTITVTDLTSASAPQFSGVFDVEPGTNVTDLLPTQTALMIEWATAKRGRNFRGKTYLSGFCEDTSDKSPVVGLIGAGNLFGINLIANYTYADGVNAKPAIVSRFSGKIPNPNPLSNRRFIPQPRVTGIATPIVLGTCETVWKTQRRRAING